MNCDKYLSGYLHPTQNNARKWDYLCRGENKRFENFFF